MNLSDKFSPSRAFLLGLTLPNIIITFIERVRIFENKDIGYIDSIKKHA